MTKVGKYMKKKVYEHFETNSMHEGRNNFKIVSLVVITTNV
jgi:hypothetical protein